MSTSNPKISIEGLDFEWDIESGQFLTDGHPTVCMWIETTMAGLMISMQKVVGTERLNLMLRAGGRDSVAGDLQHLILPATHPEEALRLVGRWTNLVGLGGWEVVEFDRAKSEARFRVKPTNWETVYQKEIGVCWGASSLAGKFDAYCSTLFGTPCWAEQVSFAARGDEYDEFVVKPSQRTLEGDLNALIDAGKATSEDLSVALAELKREIHERKLAEARLEDEIQQRREIEEEHRAKLALIERQESAIRAMSTPILQIWEGVLTMPIIGLVDSMRAAQMMESLLERISQTRAQYAILDLTGVDVIDTTAANHLLKLVRAASLLGSRCLLSGISPSMASTIVGIGLDMAEIATFSTLEAALRHAIRGAGEQAPARGEARGWR